MNMAVPTASFLQGFAPSLAILLSAASALALAGCTATPEFIGRTSDSAGLGGDASGAGGGSSGTGIGGDIAPAGGGAAQGASSSSGGGNDGCAPRLEGVVRDFKAYGTPGGHPDFERFAGTGLEGIVEPVLGPDQKPVYAHEGATEYTSGPEYFDQWFRDVLGVNRSVRYFVPLDVSDGVFRLFRSKEFFPIDGQGWGNQGWDHNYGFTFELHMRFRYRGEDDFIFGGDDDIWVFINNQLVMDLGGVHGSMFDTIDLDEMAEELGLELGKDYPLDIFFAERRSGGSSFMISTLLYTNCDPIIL
ncbi:fibro-slime domain-containing protein [Sorangium sp. So ce1335]|uniref:fibro-slime domain-containing protein n=1 Tax=Sorangium sp. So ce1335 TaxID=3133335 RepID=UPI003F62DD7C